MRYGTAVGAWGDCFVAYGKARAVIQQLGEPVFGLIHYGFDPAISAFLRLQEGVADVRHVIPESREIYNWYLHQMLCVPSCLVADYASQILKGTGIAPEQVVRTHVYHLNFRQAVHRWHNPLLPESAMNWARDFVAAGCDGKPFLLLHPYSVQSTPLEDHWPGWRRAIEWLAEIAGDFGVKLLWTGTDNPLDIRSPQIVDALRRTPSMMEVFALQRLAQLTISTTNGLAHWAVMDNCPTIACCNNHMLPTDRHIFKEWISAPPVSQVEYTDKLDRFQSLVCGALSEAVAG